MATPLSISLDSRLPPRLDDYFVCQLALCLFLAGPPFIPFSCCRDGMYSSFVHYFIALLCIVTSFATFSAPLFFPRVLGPIQQRD